MLIIRFRGSCENLEVALPFPGYKFWMAESFAKLALFPANKITGFLSTSSFAGETFSGCTTALKQEVGCMAKASVREVRAQRGNLST